MGGYQDEYLHDRSWREFGLAFLMLLFGLILSAGVAYLWVSATFG